MEQGEFPFLWLLGWLKTAVEESEKTTESEQPQLLESEGEISEEGNQRKESLKFCA